MGIGRTAIALLLEEGATRPLFGGLATLGRADDLSDRSGGRETIRAFRVLAASAHERRPARRPEIVHEYQSPNGRSDSRSKNFLRPLARKKSNRIPRVTHSQEMLVSQNESAIRNLRYDTALFTHHERDVAAFR